MQLWTNWSEEEWEPVAEIHDILPWRDLHHKCYQFMFVVPQAPWIVLQGYHALWYRKKKEEGSKQTTFFYTTMHCSPV